MDLVSPQPFWLLKNGLLNVYPSLKEDLRADVVVLGGGITGAMVAESLSAEGLNVVVLDKRDVGSGSTSASTALVQYECDAHLRDLSAARGWQEASRVYRLCYEAVDVIEQLVTRLKVDCGFRRRKSVYLASRAEDAAPLREESDLRRRASIEVEYLNTAEVEARFSFSRPAALVSEQAAELDCHRLAHALLARAVTNGARVFDRTEVQQYETGAHGVRLHTSRGCIVSAAHAVFAVGYEAREFLSRRIVRLKSTYALASEPVADFPGWWERAQIWETARPYLYLRTTDEGRIFVGGGDDPFRNPRRRDRRVEARTRELENRFREMFPQIELKVACRWAGTFGETKDALPYIGQIRQMPRCHFALGFGGNGITFGIIAAQIIRDVLLDRPNPDGRLFRFDR